MNLLNPVSTIMTKKLFTVNSGDSLYEVREIFENNKIHHIPVVSYKKLLGIISESDFLHFLRGFETNKEDRFLNETRLKAHTVEEIMTSGIATIESTDRINVAIEIFNMNMFHAIPVVDNDELVGILTTHDIIKALACEKPKLEEYQASK